MFLFRKFLFVFLLGFLLLPIIENKTQFVSVHKLIGIYDLSRDTELTAKGWFSAKYQVHEELFLRDSFGFRNLFVRANNQLDYSLFKKIHAKDVVIGKNDDMFYGWYLKTYNGSNFIGSSDYKVKIDQLKYIQDTLAKLNKTFLLVIAPSKGRFEPENLPDSCKLSDSTNYSICVKFLKEKKVNNIDFNRYFISLRNKSKYPLFYKYGSHWSAYGACMAGDSIISMLEKLRNVSLPHTPWKDRIVSEEAGGSELDLEDGLNLLFPFKHSIMGHPRVSHSDEIGKNGPSALVICDSYYQGLVMDYNFWDIFSSENYCFYYKDVYTLHTSGFIDIADFNLKDAIAKNDMILLIVSEANLASPGWGFPDAACKTLKVGVRYDNRFKPEIMSMRANLQKDSGWIKDEIRKAKDNNIPLDSMVTIDAIWMVEHQNN